MARACFRRWPNPPASCRRPPLKEPTPDRDVMMPRRKQTREQCRRERIAAERRERTELIAEEERQRQA